jgi:hypothetical protein
MATRGAGLDDLPDACLARVAQELCAPHEVAGVALRARGDAACDAIKLHLASCPRLAAHVRALVDPPGECERLLLRSEPTRRVTVAELKALCREERVPVSGASAALRERLWRRVERAPRTGLLTVRAWETARREAGAAAWLGLGARERLVKAFESVEENVGTCSSDLAGPRRAALRQTAERLGADFSAGDAPWRAPHAVLAAALRRVEEALKEAARLRAERREALSASLEARGCTLRADSHVCSAYIEGSTARTLEQVLDETEEIQFFWRRTQYPALLRSMRDRARGFHDREFDRDFGSRAYWRRRERYRDGRDSGDSGDSGDSDDSDDSWGEDDEERVRRAAKAEALARYLRDVPANDRVPLPAGLRASVAAAADGPGGLR